MLRRIPCLVPGVLISVVCALHGNAQSHAVEEIRNTAKQLRWSDEAGLRSYERTKASVTEHLLTDLDEFVIQNFKPSTTTADSVARSLDAALGYENGDLTHNVAFSVDLVGARFLVVGVELSRGGPAIPEDAVSFRAYKAVENKFALVAHTDVWNIGVNLHAITLPSTPTQNELWFLSSAVVNTQAPPMVAIRLYAFGGSDFRMIWLPTDSRDQVCQNCVLSEGPEEVLDMTASGFVVKKLFGPTGQAAHSPTVMIHEQFVVTAAGPQKLSEWQTQYP